MQKIIQNPPNSSSSIHLLPPPMASIFAITLLITLVLLFYLPPQLRATNPMSEIIARWCTGTNAKDSRKYLDHYNSSLLNMTARMRQKKFATDETGEPPDKIYVMSQCFRDLSADDCVQCFVHIKEMLLNCFPKTGGRVYLEGCFIRADNYSFYQEVSREGDSKICSDSANTTEDYPELVKDVLSRILNKAPKKNGFAFETDTINGTIACGIGQCWKLLDGKMCYDCLTNAMQSALQCLPSEEGRVLNAGCFMRYSNYILGKDPDDELTERDSIIEYVTYVLIAFLICALAIGVGFFVGKMSYRHLNRRESEGDTMDYRELDQDMKSMQFKYSTLEKATESFDEANKLGSGAFGEIFKGTLPDGREIAIKRLYASGKNRAEEIFNEIDVISRVQHKNLAHFLGCCLTKRESFLIFEYLANKSLSCSLFDPEKKKELDWKRRRGIIIGTAEGLAYLHKGCEVKIIHRDIKASNVLLDLKYKPKIADFGLARFDKKSLVTNPVAGTFGYMAPEYLSEGKLTEKVDVYSFGVLVLEIVSGISNTKVESDNSFETLVTNSWKHFQADTTSKLIDKSLELSDERVEEIKRVIHVGLLCTQETPSLRPSMNVAIQMLENKDMELPTPTKPPFVDQCMEFSSLLSLPLNRSDVCSKSDDIVHNPK